MAVFASRVPVAFCTDVQAMLLAHLSKPSERSQLESQEWLMRWGVLQGLAINIIAVIACNDILVALI